MVFDNQEARSILRMIETEHLDIRAVTLGVSLRGCAAASLAETCDRVYDHLMRVAARLVPVAAEVQAAYGVPIVNKRVAVTPVALIGEPSGARSYVPLAHVLDRAAAELGIDYIAGFSALVEKGMTAGDCVLIDSIPEALATTERVCSSVNVATTRAGINMDAVLAMGHVIKALAERTADRDGIGCAKLVTFANMPEDNPFVAGAMHGVGEGDLSLNVGVSGPGVVLSALRRLREGPGRVTLSEVAETIKRMAFKVTRAGELIGREVARRLGPQVRFGIVDLSLAPTPVIGDSVAEILEVMGLERTGCPGTTAALALLTDAVKKGGAMASSSVGGLSGAFIPVAEDHDMAAAVEAGALSLAKLEAMTAVCSVGLDMVAVPGDTSAETLAAIIADEIAIGVFNGKTTAVRIIPVPGKRAGERAVYGGLLGEAPIMAVSSFSPSSFVRMGGRIPAPLISLRN
ncbi:MAG: PFL family protein [Myxococcales bacterium]|nr:PFL family protein [Myxococcota bacterium]MDW8281588.1 PFL family protein [Myxococcales bacterium]